MILQPDWFKRLAYHCNISTVANTVMSQLIRFLTTTITCKAGPNGFIPCTGK